MQVLGKETRIRLFRPAFLLILILLIIGRSRATILDVDYFDYREIPHNGFVVPNEHNIHEAKQIFFKASSGVYIGLGTERGFLALGYLKSITHGIFIDEDLSVVKYNRYNIALLKISNSRSHYLYLRYKASFEEIQLLTQKNQLTEYELRLLNDSLQFKGWREVQASKTNQELLNPQKLGLIHYQRFGDNIYIRSDRIFEKIKSLADSGSLEAHQIQLKDEIQVSQFVVGLKKAGVLLSMLDLSNAWSSEYLSPQHLKDLVGVFSSISLPNSLLFLSQQDIRTGVGQLLARSMFWSYSAFSFQFLIERMQKSADSWYLDVFVYFKNGAINGQALGFGAGQCSTLFKNR